MTVLTRTSVENYPYARIAVDLNKDGFSPFYVGVSDETGALGRLLQLSVTPATPVRWMTTLVAGRSRTYAAYLTQGPPRATGGPGAAPVGQGHVDRVGQRPGVVGTQRSRSTR